MKSRQRFPEVAGLIACAWIASGCGSDASSMNSVMTPGGSVSTPSTMVATPSGVAGRSTTPAPTTSAAGTTGARAGSGALGGGVAGSGVAGSGTTPTAAGAAGAATAGTGTTGAAGSATAGTGSATAGAVATAGASGSAAGSGAAGGGSTGTMGMGMCCKDGDCLCHGDPPSAPTNMAGPFKTMSYDIPSAGCVYYPTDAQPPFAAVTISDGFGGAGGCGPTQTNQWGPLYASWGIVAMIIHTGSSDQPNVRGQKLTAGVAAFKMENMKSGSPLMGKLSGRYGTSGFSMGGGGTTFSAAKDPMLKSNVAIMAWGPTSEKISVPSLFIFGSSDTLASTMGMSAYKAMDMSAPKMTVTVNSGHAGQPSSGGGASGKAGLAWQKVYLEGDERWEPILKMVMATDSANVK